MSRVDLLTEALAAVHSSHGAHAAAGMSQYDDYFATRIEEFEAAITAMQNG